MTIKIEFPANRPDIAQHIGAALTAVGNDRPTTLEKEIESHDGSDLEEFRENILTTLAEKLKLDRNVLSGALLSAASSENFSGAEIEESKEIEQTGKVDTKNVVFDADFCGNAAEPFYKSGARNGQWKKKKGVAEEAYDVWYAAQLALLAGATAEPTTTVDTGTAFGAGGAAEQTAAEPIPHDAGTLMAWVSGMQSAGRLTQDQVNAAYQQAGLGMQNIFPSPDNTPEVIAQRVGMLHTILNSWA